MLLAALLPCCLALLLTPHSAIPFFCFVFSVAQPYKPHDISREADKFMNTAVHVAGYRGFAGVLKVMIARGANLDAVNRDGCTPLHFACAQGHARRNVSQSTFTHLEWGGAQTLTGPSAPRIGSQRLCS